MSSVDLNVEQKETEKIEAPTGLAVIWRELIKDKLALFSFVLLIGLVLFIYIYSFFLNQDEIT